MRSALSRRDAGQTPTTILDSEEIAKVTAKFSATDRQVVTATFDTVNGTVQDTTGGKGSFTAVPGTKAIEITNDQAVTFQVQDPVQFIVGFKTGYTASTGKSGTVAIEKVD